MQVYSLSQSDPQDGRYKATAAVIFRTSVNSTAHSRMHGP